jgi:uncharacterized protein YbgA (DUF1722 family)/uncharacterized protein YbbK (DUF523 family)
VETPPVDSKPRLGISTCLLGEAVRWDGGHKRDSYLTGTLSRFVEWVSVCPEVEVGMGVPRPTVRLVGAVDDPRMVETESGRDWTEALRQWAHRRVDALESLDLCGYVLKKDSPSCGMERVKVSAPGTPGRRAGRGLFAAVLMERMPLLPVEEEGRLTDLGLREAFLDRVFAYDRWRTFRRARPRRAELVAFHARAKFSLLAHSERHLRRLGPVVAQAKGRTLAAVLEEYGRLYAEAFQKPATRKSHRNVLEHLAGFVSDPLTHEERAELQEAIADHAAGLVPLIVPITLLRHHARKQAAAYVLEQTYLSPHPKELMLRNHV